MLSEENLRIYFERYFNNIVLKLNKLGFPQDLPMINLGFEHIPNKIHFDISSVFIYSELYKFTKNSRKVTPVPTRLFLKKQTEYQKIQNLSLGCFINIFVHLLSDCMFEFSNIGYKYKRSKTIT